MAPSFLEKGEKMGESECRLKCLRKQKGLSQGQLAKASDLTPMVISRLERGETSMLETRLKTVLAIADVLDVVDVRDLI
jgi:transcriptional regulator with XRE-family HTH domain